MSKQCTICGKGSLMFGRRKKLRGKYNPTEKIRKYPNLQWLKVPEDVTHKNFKEHRGQRLKACTKCIKTLAKKNQ